MCNIVTMKLLLCFVLATFTLVSAQIFDSVPIQIVRPTADHKGLEVIKENVNVLSRIGSPKGGSTIC